MSYRGRFAPSPTGHLHFGSLVAAVGSWLCARHAGGQWLLRVEDIDPPREMPGSAESILAALPAFGLVADAAGAVPVQTHSRPMTQAFEQLQAANLVFPCWCSRNDLAEWRCTGMAHAWRHPPKTAPRPGGCACRISRSASTTPCKAANARTCASAAGDFVIRRVEGYYAYQLACVVDDAFQGITEVVRGNDLLDSTPRQIWLQRCLGLPTPTYLHLPLALDASGRKLSKSERAHPVDPADPMPALRRALGFPRSCRSHRTSSTAA